MVNLKYLLLNGNELTGALWYVPTYHTTNWLLIWLIAGQISNEVFAFLCRLGRFDLSGNAGLDRSTLAGHLACTMTNLKDATQIDAPNKRLEGNCVVCSIIPHNELASKFGFLFREHSCRARAADQVGKTVPEQQPAHRCIVVCSSIPRSFFNRLI